MRKILLVAALAFGCGAAYAQSSPAAPEAAPAAQPAAPATTAVPAAQPAPAAQAQPDAATPTTKASKPAKKRVVKRRWQSDEAKARGIAAKYGVTW